MAVSVAHMFPDCLTLVPTQLFFPDTPTTFLTCFCRGEKQKYAVKKSRLNRGSNLQPPDHESDTLTTEPPGHGQIKCGCKFKISIGKGRKYCGKRRKCWLPAFSPFPSMFSKGFSVRGVSLKVGIVC